MKRTIASIIEQYGSTITVHTGQDAQEIRAFLQPVMSLSWQNMERMFPAGGEIPRGQYIYIGKPDFDILQVDYLSLDGKSYIVRRADTIKHGDESLYVWGLCVQGGRKDPWRH